MRSNADTGLSGWSIFLDSNRNGLHEIGELTETTDASGFYAFSEIPVGEYVLSAQLAEGWGITTAHDAVRTESEASSASAHLASPDPVSSDNVFATKHVPGQLIVQLTDATLADPFVLTALRDQQQRLGQETLHIMQSGLELWNVGPDITAAYTLWADDPRIAFIEPNYTFTVADTVPDDERFENMWALDNTGQTGGLIDADIDAPEAWDLQTGNTDVVIGVIDSGIDYTHPDLAENIWTNPGEIAGNGIDDDDNGYIDDIHGWDFSSGDADPLDGHGHGTHVAGTIAAAGNNEIGVAGVNWNAKLMPLRFLNNAGSGSIYHALRALEYATMMGAQITNNSWIGDNYSSLTQIAIDQANAAGSIYVVCAGNDPNDNDSTPTYPASYLGDNVITVAATTHTDALSSFSNYGESSVDLGAPGSSILSTKSGGGYTTKSGTSMATPHVAGVASLLLSKRPDLAPVEVRQAILQGTDSVESLSGKTVSGGRLNAYGALMEVAPANGQFVDVQASISVGTHFGIYSSTANPHTLVAILDNGDEGFTQSGFAYQSNSLVAAAYGGDNHNMRGGSGSANWTFTGLEDGEYQVAATWLHKYDNA
ncbi:MAG: S8 family serine peptidase, partial [Planctomycetales bacterium]